MPGWRILCDGNKQNLLLRSPLIAGSGAVAGITSMEVDCEFGAVMTPLLCSAEASRLPQALGRTTAGYLVPTRYGCQSWGSARRAYRRAKRGSAPIVAVVAPDAPAYAARMVAELITWESIQAIALYPQAAEITAVTQIVEIVADQTDIPIWLRLPAFQPGVWVAALEHIKVAAYIVATPLPGKARLPNGRTIAGELHTPALMPYFAQLISEIHSEIPIIARADASSTSDVLALLAAGAKLVILEGALWAIPDLGKVILSDLEALSERFGTGHDWDAFLSHLRATPA